MFANQVSKLLKSGGTYFGCGRNFGMTREEFNAQAKANHVFNMHELDLNEGGKAAFVMKMGDHEVTLVDYCHS